MQISSGRLGSLSVPVQSSLLASVNYQPEKSVLDLEFREDGIIYRYFHVPRETYTSLLTAESKGSWPRILHTGGSPRSPSRNAIWRWRT
jgi:KTSC domain